MEFTIHYNALDGIELSSIICHPMKKKKKLALQSPFSI